MKIEHAALWTRNLEAAKSFYSVFFSGISSVKYSNPETGFQSYFMSFDTGARLELMQIPGISTETGREEAFFGYSHIAFSVGSRAKVDELTEKLRQHNYKVIREPRQTGDGYYESCVLDADNNRVEITE